MLTSNDSSGFVCVSDVIPDVMLDVRYYGTYNFVGERIDGYVEPIILLTKEATKALQNVSMDAMKSGYRLKLFDGYRPQRAVDHFIRWAKQKDQIAQKAFFYPDVKKADLFRLGFVAAKSGHSRGSTIDLTLFAMATQQDIDMGGTFDWFGERSWSEQKNNLTQLQIDNRAFLRDMMKRHGFRPLAEEWWHFTLENEPFPHTYFDFPVTHSATLGQNG